MENNTPVDLELEGIVQDDAAQAPDNTMSLEDAISPPELQQERSARSEPGWIKQRVEKAVEKRLAEVESRLRSEYETQMAPMREAMFEREADKLVAEGEFKSRERALEYVRLKGGAPAPKTEEAPAAPRDAQGRFAPKQTAGDDVQVRAQRLYDQAEAIFESSGIDVTEIYNSDPEVRRKVSTGEWSFLDVYRSLPQARPRVPSPTRSANNGSLAGIDIAKMSDVQFAKLNKTLAEGGVVNFNK